MQKGIGGVNRGFRNAAAEQIPRRAEATSSE